MKVPTSETYNIDCMEYMKTLPDNAFDLAVVDPPYGDAGSIETEHRNQRGRFDRYNNAVTCSQIGNVERERERERETQYNRFGNPGSRFERYKRPVLSTTCTAADASKRERESK